MTSTIDGPRLLEADEFFDAMDLVNRCFGFDPGGLEDRMPHCFDEEHPKRHAIIRRDGSIVSHVACVPAELIAGDARIDCHGIAGVATDPEYRGNGYMTRLVEFWLDELADRGVPLVELEGDRVRYGRFGWENAGREVRYRITVRSFGAEVGDPDRVRPYSEGDHLATLRSIHGTERYRVARNRRRYKRLLGQTGLKTVVYHGEDPAYLSYRGTDPASVLEFGGSSEGVATLLDRVLDRADELTVYTHPHHPLNTLFRTAAADWDRGPHRKLNLLDLPGLIEAYEPLLEERWSRFAAEIDVPDDAITLGMDDRQQSAIAVDGDSVTIDYGPDGIVVEDRERSPDVTLGRRDLVDLLFGSPDTCRPAVRSEPFLRVVLPLEFYFWQTETI